MSHYPYSTVWEKCRPLFEPVIEKFESESVTKLLQLNSNYDVDGDAEASAAHMGIMTLEDRMRASVNSMRGIEDEGHIYASYEGLERFLQWVRDEIRNAREKVSAKAPFDRAGTDFQCIVLVNTLIHDRWYEIGKSNTAVKRERGYPYAALLWSLVMEYRYWKRRGLIECENVRAALGDNTEISPVFIPTGYFRKELGGVCEVPEGLDQVPVLKWSPERTFLAMQRISMARIKGYLPIGEKQQTLKRYVNALLDRLAILNRGVETGPIDRLCTQSPDWYAPVHEPGKERETGTSDVKTVQLEIKHIREKEFAEAKKSSVFKIKEAAEKLYVERRGDIRGVLREYEKGLTELGQFKKRKEIMESLRADLTGDNYSESLVAMNTLDDEIKRIETIMSEQQQQLQEKLEDDARQKNASGMKVSEEKASDILADVRRMIEGRMGGKAEENAVVETSHDSKKEFAPTINWAKDNMILSMHLITRHSKVRGMGMMSLTASGAQMRATVRQEIFKSLGYANEKDIMSEAELFIIEHLETQSWEREYYRNSLSKKVVFKSMDAWRNARDEGRVEIRLDGFERTNIAYVLDPTNNHPYFSEAIGYALYWWLTQKYPMFGDIDLLFYFWDIENEYLSLYRRKIATPFMSRIGGEWVVFPGGEWEDSEGEWANVIWCGDDAIGCFVEFVHCVYRERWRLTYRDPHGHTVYSLENTVIWDLLHSHFQETVEEVSEPYSPDPPAYLDGDYVPEGVITIPH